MKYFQVIKKSVWQGQFISVSKCTVAKIGKPAKLHIRKIATRSVWMTDSIWFILVFNTIMVYSLQEINGITAALAEELFHKGKAPARIYLGMKRCIRIPMIFTFQSIRDLSLGYQNLGLLFSFFLLFALWFKLQFGRNCNSSAITPGNETNWQIHALERAC